MPDIMRRVTDADPIDLDEVRALATGRFGDMVKGVVDLRRGALLLDADMHADQEAELLADGSAQADLWGINLYPDGSHKLQARNAPSPWGSPSAVVRPCSSSEDAPRRP
jgi:hypothetical protein